MGERGYSFCEMRHDTGHTPGRDGPRRPTRTGGDAPVEQAALFGDLITERMHALELLDRAAALRGLARQVRERTGAHIGFAGPIEDDDLLVLRHWSGTRATAMHDLHVPLGRGLGGSAFARSTPVWVQDYRSSKSITHDFDVPICHEGIHSMLAVPMVREGRILGVVYAAMREVVELGDRRLDAVVDLANTGALALETATAAQRQREMTAAGERRRIASSLHDSVGARLFRIGAELRDMRSLVDGSATELTRRLESLERQLAETSSEFRESVYSLDHEETGLGIGATLSSDCARFEQRTGVSAQAVEIGTVPACDPQRTRVVVAAAREALLNVEKHADARSVLVSTLEWDGGIVVSVADDGNGWPDDESGSESGGMGLSSTSDRLESVGGTLSVVANEDGGLTVRIWVPVS